MTTALLVIDMQDEFLGMTTTALPNVLKLIDHFKAHHLPIFFTQHGHTKEELTPPYKNQIVRRWGPSGSIAIGTEAWQLIPEIAQRVEGYPVVAKNTYDAFINTNLGELLSENQVERVIVSGVMTNCCCDTTARSAGNRGFETWLVEDACGSVTKKQHEAGLMGFGFAFGDVVETAGVMSQFR
ncbi:hypothetical protein P7C71_g5715, partial [Lecanoromycetidae sp. Uapishka_2]